jgi:hypothetical protein
VATEPAWRLARTGPPRSIPSHGEQRGLRIKPIPHRRQEQNMATGDSGPTHEEIPKLEEVYTANGEVEAATIKSALEAAGIDAELKFESLTRQLPVTVNGLGAVKIMVAADRADEARAIIETPAEPVGEDA